MNEDLFSSRRAKIVSLSSMEISRLIFQTFRMLSIDSLTVRNTGSQNPGNDENLLRHCNHLGVSAGIILALRMSAFEFTTSFYRAYLIDWLFSYLSSSCLSKLRWGIAFPSICFSSVFLYVFSHVARKKKPHCIVLPGMATTLLPKHFVKPVVM